MQQIHPNSHVQTEVEFTDLKVQLPGHSDNDTGLSAKQFAQVQRFADSVNMSAVPWGSAAQQLRELLGTVGRPDFVLVNTIFSIGYAETAGNPLSEKQQDVLLSIMGVLSGTETHFDVGIQTRADQLVPEVRGMLQVESLKVRTSGQFSEFLDLWTRFTGKVTPRVSDQPPADVPLNLVGDEQF